MNKLKPLEELLKLEQQLEGTNIKTQEEKSYFTYLKDLQKKALEEYSKFANDRN